MADIIGQTFGRLTVISELPKEPKKRRRVLCSCTCGNTKESTVSNLKTGGVTSCGCITKERLTKHGYAGTRKYQMWRDMLKRCNDTHNVHYLKYGGRGIKVCAEWENLNVFIEWLDANDYNDTLTLDRKDNDLGYSPENCRLVTRNVQQANRRSFSNSSSQFIGVTRTKHNTWTAQIQVNGVNTYIGTYPTEVEAAHARDAYVSANNLPHTLNLG